MQRGHVLAQKFLASALGALDRSRTKRQRFLVIIGGGEKVELLVYSSRFGPCRDEIKRAREI